MIKISQQQALTRWDTLPDNLKTAIFSDYNAEILWRVCENQHLAEDKIQKIAELAGEVLMGFIHPEDFASEIREALNINAEIADAIAVEINRKIFSQFKNDLEKIYQPSPSEKEETEEGQTSPTLDLRNKTEESSFKIVEDENKIDLSVKKGMEPVVEKVVPVENVAFTVKKIEEPVLMEKEEKKIEEPTTISFETPASAPAMPAEAAVETPKNEGPLIIHQEVGFKPLSGKLKSLGGMFNFLRSKDEFKKEEAPVKAELEIGEEFKIMEDQPAPAKKEEYKPEIKKEELVSTEKEAVVEETPAENKVFEAVKVVNYSEVPEQPVQEKVNISQLAEEKTAGFEKFEVVKMPAEPVSEVVPENLQEVKEDVKEIKIEAEPEAKTEEKIEENNPETGKKEESEEMVDLGMFK
ncbi:MAG: hypothetical protein WC461_01150 [Candidatus Paceibacterota bacterium]